MKGQTLKEDRKGFTLVELIVVIAILAILAAVAYPVYTGYITKANEAADQVLLGAVNESFRSALYDVGYTDGELPEMATAALTEQKVSEVSSAGIAGLNDAFFKYFEGNANTAFKVVKALLYNQTQGFYASLGENEFIFGENRKLVKKGINAAGKTMWEWSTEVGDFTLTTNEENIESFNNSSFGKNMTMDGLMGEIDKLVTGVTGVVESVSPEQYLTKDIMDMLKKAGYTPGTDDYKKAAVRALVVQSAMQSDCWTVDGLLEDMKNGRLSTTPALKEGDGSQARLASANAMFYAMITGYAKSEAGKNTTVTIWNQGEGRNFTGTVAEYYDHYITNAINGENGLKPSQAYGEILTLMQGVIDTPEYKDYLNSGEGKKDIEGYLGAMEFIRDNADSIVSSKTLDAGYSDPALAELLSTLFAG